MVAGWIYLEDGKRAALNDRTSTCKPFAIQYVALWFTFSMQFCES